jgi:hypothetical protein
MAVDETPTMNLRFVERPIQDGDNLRLVKILQQEWTLFDVNIHGRIMVTTEWRDVPLEKGFG